MASSKTLILEDVAGLVRFGTSRPMKEVLRLMMEVSAERRNVLAEVVAGRFFFKYQDFVEGFLALRVEYPDVTSSYAVALSRVHVCVTDAVNESRKVRQLKARELSAAAKSPAYRAALSRKEEKTPPTTPHKPYVSSPLSLGSGMLTPNKDSSVKHLLGMKTPTKVDDSFASLLPDSPKLGTSDMQLCELANSLMGSAAVSVTVVKRPLVREIHEGTSDFLKDYIERLSARTSSKPVSKAVSEIASVTKLSGTEDSRETYTLSDTSCEDLICADPQKKSTLGSLNKSASKEHHAVSVSSVVTPTINRSKRVVKKTKKVEESTSEGNVSSVSKPGKAKGPRKRAATFPSPERVHSRPIIFGGSCVPKVPRRRSVPISNFPDEKVGNGLKESATAKHSHNKSLPDLVGLSKLPMSPDVPAVLGEPGTSGEVVKNKGVRRRSMPPEDKVDSLLDETNAPKRSRMKNHAANVIENVVAGEEVTVPHDNLDSV